MRNNDKIKDTVLGVNTSVIPTETEGEIVPTVSVPPPAEITATVSKPIQQYIVIAMNCWVSGRNKNVDAGEIVRANHFKGGEKEANRLIKEGYLRLATDAEIEAKKPKKA